MDTIEHRDRARIPIDLGTTVSDGEQTYPVCVVPYYGHFYVKTADGSEITKPTLAALQEYFEQLAKRRRVKARDARDGVEVTVLISHHYGDEANARTVKILGISDAGNRVLSRGMPQGEKLEWSETLYRAFTSEEYAELNQLQMAVREATRARDRFLALRRLERRAHNIGKALDAGEADVLGPLSVKAEDKGAGRTRY